MIHLFVPEKGNFPEAVSNRMVSRQSNVLGISQSIYKPKIAEVNEKRISDDFPEFADCQIQFVPCVVLGKRKPDRYPVGIIIECTDHMGTLVYTAGAGAATGSANM